LPATQGEVGRLALVSCLAARGADSMTNSTSSSVLWAASVLLALPIGASDAAPTRFKIGVEETAIYAVEFHDLSAVGLVEPVPTSRIGLSSQGRQVPVWLEDGGDGEFGPGDRLEFVGRQLVGESGRFHEFSRFNVYWLETDATAPLHGEDLTPLSPCPPRAVPLWSKRHLEHNTLRVRFNSRPWDRSDVWFWARMAHSDEQRLAVTLPLDDIDRASSESVKVRLRFKGWSSVRSKNKSDHLVSVRLGNSEPTRHSWNNAPTGHLIGDLEVSVQDLVEAEGRVEIWVPGRPKGKDFTIDVVLLDWIEIEYPRSSNVTASFGELWRAGAVAIRFCERDRRG